MVKWYPYDTLWLETMQALCRGHIGAPLLPKRVILVALHDLW